MGELFLIVWNEMGPRFNSKHTVRVRFTLTKEKTDVSCKLQILTKNTRDVIATELHPASEDIWGDMGPWTLAENFETEMEYEGYEDGWFMQAKTLESDKNDKNVSGCIEPMIELTYLN